MTTIYTKDGVTVSVDNEAVAIYVENVLAVEMTRAEWAAVRDAMEGAPCD